MLSVSKTVSVSRKSSKREMTRGKKKSCDKFKCKCSGLFLCNPESCFSLRRRGWRCCLQDSEGLRWRGSQLGTRGAGAAGRPPGDSFSGEESRSRPTSALRCRLTECLTSPGRCGCSPAEPGWRLWAPPWLTFPVTAPVPSQTTPRPFWSCSPEAPPLLRRSPWQHSPDAGLSPLRWSGRDGWVWSQCPPGSPGWCTPCRVTWFKTRQLVWKKKYQIRQHLLHRFSSNSKLVVGFTCRL